MIKSFKKTPYGLLKTLASLFLFITTSIGIAHLLSSYLNTWTPESTDKIPYICYIAVDNGEQFIKFREFSNQPLTHQETATKDEGFDAWELTTENKIKKVDYRGDDYNSSFRYRLHNNQAEPLSCRIFGVGHALSGFFYTMLLFLLVSWGRRFYHWRQARKLRM